MVIFSMRATVAPPGTAKSVIAFMVNESPAPAPPSIESNGDHVAVEGVFVVSTVAVNVSSATPPVNLAPSSIPVVSEPVKASQKPIVFNELRVVLGGVFGLTHRRPNCKKYALPGFAIGAVFAQVDGHSLTHCPPNPPMDGIVGGVAGVFSQAASRDKLSPVWDERAAVLGQCADTANFRPVALRTADKVLMVGLPRVESVR